MLAQLEKVSRSYPQPGEEAPAVVLRDIDLQVPEGASIAVTGPSGSGKSTLLNILGTLDQPTSGKVFLDGCEVSTLKPDKLAQVRNRFIGFVFQQHFLLPQLTLLENILLPAIPVKDPQWKQEARERAMQLIGRLGLSAHTQKLPSQLSVGECQRTAIVRALVNRPRLLLADEPTGSLDRENAKQVTEMLMRLASDHHFSMVVVTHSSEVAGHLEKVYALSSGSIHPAR